MITIYQVLRQRKKAFSSFLSLLCPYLAICPAQFDLIHAPKLVDVLSELVPHML